jgi:diadenosine tetraphosphate (Ap4A) HIT family hydrolase
MPRTSEGPASTPGSVVADPTASALDPSCDFCQRIGPSPEIQDRVVYEDPFFLAAHQLNDAGPTYRGALLLQTKRHVGDLASLTDEEAAALGRALVRLSQALKQRTGAAWEYCFSFTEAFRHVHFVLASRYADLPKEFVRLSFADWPGAPRSEREGIVVLSRELRNLANAGGRRPAPRAAGGISP